MEQSTEAVKLSESSDKREYWRKLSLEWESSGESQVKFCENRNLSYTTFCYWRSFIKQQAKRPDSTKVPNSKFIPIQLSNEQPSSVTSLPMTIRLPNGVVISLPTEINHSQQSFVLRLLGVK